MNEGITQNRILRDMITSRLHTPALAWMLEAYATLEMREGICLMRIAPGNTMVAALLQEPTSRLLMSEALSEGLARFVTIVYAEGHDYD